MNAEKMTISMQIASAFSPSAMFSSVQYCDAVITRPSSASNCVRRERGVSAAHAKPPDTLCKTQSTKTHHERLVERKHDNQLDRQELGERLAALELVLREPVEDEQAV